MQAYHLAGHQPAVGECRLTHEGLLVFLTGLLRLGEPLRELFRLRHDEEPRFFHYLVTFADGGLMHEFGFVIDDSISPDHLFIEDFEYDASPI